MIQLVQCATWTNKIVPEKEVPGIQFKDGIIVQEWRIEWLSVIL